MSTTTRPLDGRRILVTRPRAQAAVLCDKLTAAGAEPVLFPTIQIAPLADYTALDRAISQLASYRWIIFTSVNGVAAFWDRLAAAGADPQVMASARVAAIGPATGSALLQRGVQAEFIPEEYVAERILDGLGEVMGQWVLLPRAEAAREALAVELGRRGAIVHEIAAYRTLPEAPDPDGLAGLRAGVAAITFTSSSTVRNFAALAGRQTYGAAVACIGPITARTAQEAGFQVDVMARDYTMDGLVAALVEHFSRMEN
jgi:uroporphyrinogen-III synthase